MSTDQLQSTTPNGADGITVCLSDKTRAVAHSAFDYKTGYMTLARYNESTTKWRSVHLAKKSCSILMEEAPSLLTAMDTGDFKQVKLTRRQFLMTTKFQKTGGGEDMMFISLLHPFTETDSVQNTKDCNHAKTINLNKEEFVKLIEFMPKLMDKMGTPREQKKEEDESATIRAYKWVMPDRFTSSVGLFPTPELCRRSVMAYLTSIVTEYVPVDDDFKFDIIPVDLERPSKINIVEHVYYTLLLEKTGIPMSDLMLETPSMEILKKADALLLKNEVVEVSTAVAAKLANKRLYLVPEAFDLFSYMSGKDKVMYYIVKNGISSSKKLYARLIDTCYMFTCKQALDHKGHFERPSSIYEDQSEEQSQST